jgi:hypothetical protein
MVKAPEQARRIGNRRRAVRQGADRVLAEMFLRRICGACGCLVESAGVLSRGVTFCSLECAASAALPGAYLG